MQGRRRRIAAAGVQVDAGIQRLAAGVDAAVPKVQAFAEQLLTHIDRVKSQVDSMPDVTFEDSMNRMLAFSRGMHEFTRS